MLKRKHVRKNWGGWLLAFLLLLAGVALPHNVQAEEAATTEAAAETTTETKYVNFTVKDKDSLPWWVSSYLELSGGRIVKTGNQYNLEIDFVKSQDDGFFYEGDSSEKTEKTKSIAYITDETEKDLFTTSVLKEENQIWVRLASGGVKRRDIYTASVPLNVTSYEEAAGTEIQLKYYAENADSTEPVDVKLELQEPKEKLESDVSVELGSSTNLLDGKVVAKKSSAYRVVGVVVTNSHTISLGAVRYYYSIDESDINENSQMFYGDGQLYADESSTSIYVSSDNPGEYTLKVRVRGQVVSSGEWLEEKVLEVPLGKASYTGEITDSSGNIGVMAGLNTYKRKKYQTDGYQNTFPLDTIMNVDKIFDEDTLKSYTAKLKNLNADYGKYYALTLKMTGADGGEVEFLKEDKNWGEGYYNKGDFEADSENDQKKYYKLLEFYLNADEGYLPSNTEIYKVNKNGSIQKLPKQLHPDDTSNRLLTTWYEDANPSGTYIVVQNKMSDPSSVLGEGNYTVKARLVESEDNYSEVSDFSGNVKNRVLASVTEDGTTTLYLTLKGADGEYVKNVKYNGDTCEVIENQTVNGKTYPKIVKVTLTEDDAKKAYIPLQLKYNGSWHSASLAMAWGTAAETDALTLTKPSIKTTTGAANFVNDATAEVEITADAVDGKIYYTTDDSEPTTSSSEYSGKITLSTTNKDGETYTVKAIVVKDGFDASAIASYKVKFAKEGAKAENTAAPVINAVYDYSKEGNGTTAATGYYKVSFSSASDGAVFYYTTDGSEPTTDSASVEAGKYVSVPAQTDGEATTIKAIAVKNDYNDSEVTSKTIEFSTAWYDNLEEGKEYEIEDTFYKYGEWNNGYKVISAGNPSIEGKKAYIKTENGQKTVRIPLGSVDVGAVTGWITDFWYRDGNASKGDKILVEESSKKYDEEGHVCEMTIPVNDNIFTTEKGGIYTAMYTTAGSLMGTQDAVLWLDVEDLEAQVTGKASEKKDTAETPKIKTSYDDAKENCEITITAAEGAKIYYSVNEEGKDEDFKEYTGAFTVKASEAGTNGMVNVSAYAAEDGKEQSETTTTKLQFTKSEESSIKDGTYKVPVSMMNAYKDEESMGNAVISKEAVVTVKNGKATIDVSFTGLDREFGGQELHGHVIKLSSYAAGTKAADLGGTGVTMTEASVVKTVEDVGLDSKTKQTFPYTYRITRDTAGEDTIYVHVVVDAVEKFPQDARLVFNWSKAVKSDASAKKKDDNSGKKTTVKTVGKKGAKFVVAGNTYKLTSVGKNPTASLVKASKKKSRLVIPATVKKNGFKVKVTAIANNACRNNKKIRTVVIGKNVKTIGSRAFMNCKNVKKIIVKSKKITKVRAKAFKNINKKAVIKVPKKKYKKYKKLFKNKGQRKTVKITK